MKNLKVLLDYNSSKIYRTFAEMFLEEPATPERIPGSERVVYMSPSIPVPMPTFCYFRKIPVIDDADWLE